jgi:hypothetical protein
MGRAMGLVQVALFILMISRRWSEGGAGLDLWDWSPNKMDCFLMSFVSYLCRKSY